MPRAAPPSSRPPGLSGLTRPPLPLGRELPSRPDALEPPLKVTRRSGALFDEEEETESSKDDSKNQEQDSSTNAPSTQQPQQGGRSAVSDLTMISSLRF